MRQRTGRWSAPPKSCPGGASCANRPPRIPRPPAGGFAGNPRPRTGHIRRASPNGTCAANFRRRPIDPTAAPAPRRRAQPRLPARWPTWRAAHSQTRGIDNSSPGRRRNSPILKRPTRAPGARPQILAAAPPRGWIAPAASRAAHAGTIPASDIQTWCRSKRAARCPGAWPPVRAPSGRSASPARRHTKWPRSSKCAIRWPANRSGRWKASRAPHPRQSQTAPVWRRTARGNPSPGPARACDPPALRPPPARKAAGRRANCRYPRWKRIWGAVAAAFAYRTSYRDAPSILAWLLARARSFPCAHAFPPRR